MDPSEATKSELDMLYKARRQLADQRREYNKQLVADARAEVLGEVMLRSVREMNESYPLLPKSIVSDMGTQEAVVFISDVHYGMVTDNIWNQYNTQICKERLGRLTDETIQICKYHHVKKLHVVLLGDMIAGALHVSVRVASEETAIEQLMHVSELLAQMVNEMSDAVPEVVVHSTYGNHARVVANKKESIHSDNMERVIPWWLRERLSRNPRVIVAESAYYEFIRVNVMGHNLAATHGDLDNIRDLGTMLDGIFGRVYGEKIDYAIMGDKHHRESFEKQGIDTYLVGSLCGTEEHANTHRLYSHPSQTVMVFDEHGLKCQYPIVFR